MTQNNHHDTALLTEIKQLIQSAEQRAAVAVNSELTLLYRQVGNRIQREVLQGERASYGEQVIEKLAADLTGAFGRGWIKKQLYHCLRTAETIELDPYSVGPLYRGFPERSPEYEI